MASQSDSIGPRPSSSANMGELLNDLNRRRARDKPLTVGVEQPTAWLAERMLRPNGVGERGRIEHDHSEIRRCRFNSLLTQFIRHVRLLPVSLCLRPHAGANPESAPIILESPPKSPSRLAGSRRSHWTHWVQHTAWERRHRAGSGNYPPVPARTPTPQRHQPRDRQEIPSAVVRCRLPLLRLSKGARGPPQIRPAARSRYPRPEQ